MIKQVSQTEITPKKLGVAVLGLGTVGTEVVQILRSARKDLINRSGAELNVKTIVVRNLDKHQDIDASLLTTDGLAAVQRDDVDIVVEVMGGITTPLKLVSAAIAAGKSVVTANKALIAKYGGELLAACVERKVDLYFEAAVAGVIPLIRPLQQSLTGDNIYKILGIVNGTTNFILSEMYEKEKGYDEILATAIKLGYAEADPIADISGLDAAAKAAILATIAFHTKVTTDEVYYEGISKITATDIHYAKTLNCVIKLIADCQKITSTTGESSVSARVFPALIPRDHPLATVSGVYNAVVVEAEKAGRIMFYGQGAGGVPTAAAMVGDIVIAAQNKVYGGRGTIQMAYANLPLISSDEMLTRFYISMQVEDRPGVLANIASTFAAANISISIVRQEEIELQAQLIIVTHHALESRVRDTITKLQQSRDVVAVTNVIRLEG